MLSLSPFDIVRPRSFAEAVEFMAEDGSLPLAGGTDLVPNMKHGLFEPKRLIDLKAVEGGDAIVEEQDMLRVGALCTIDRLAGAKAIRTRFPALAKAAASIAGPQLRRMGTLGGNICLDTRCVYYNQTYFWRSALGFCLKKDGDVCHVVPGGKRCVAAASNDTAPILMALGASVRLLSVRGERRVRLEEFFKADGVRNTIRERDELVTEVLIPYPEAGTWMSYEKLRTRKAIDFPLLGLAMVCRLGDDRTIEWMRIALNALGARPRYIGGLDRLVAKRKLDEETSRRVGAQVYKQTHPLTNILGDTQWRRDMAPVLVERALRHLEPSRERPSAVE